jgi:hypothetical protein
MEQDTKKDYNRQQRVTGGSVKTSITGGNYGAVYYDE